MNEKISDIKDILKETYVVLTDDWGRGEYRVAYCGLSIDKAFEIGSKLNVPMCVYLEVWLKGELIKKYESVMDSPYDDRPKWKKVFDTKENR